MENRTKVLFRIYIRKVFPWMLTLVGIMLLLFILYPYLYDDRSSLGGDENILYAIRLFMKHTFLLELGVVFALSYVLYYAAVGEREGTFLGSMPVCKKQQYLCMAGSVFFVIFCALWMENLIACILWDSQTKYIGGIGSALCRLVVLLFLACFCLWLFGVFSIKNWWNSILILVGVLLFFMCLLRISVSIAYLFGSEHNMLCYQLKNIFFCLTDRYMEAGNPAHLEVYSQATQDLYAHRNLITFCFCLFFLLLAALFFFLGRWGFCSYGYLGKQKQWHPKRAFVLLCCMALWMTAYAGALGSMELSWFKQTTEYTNADAWNDDWSDPWFIQVIPSEYEPYGEDDLQYTYDEIVSMCVDAGGVQKIKTSALTYPKGSSIEGSLEVAAYSDGMIYCIPQTEGKWWAKLQFFLSLFFGAALGLLFGVWQKRKAARRDA